MREVFAKGGFSPEMLADPEVAPLIEETYNALNGAIDTAIKTETPPELTAALQNNTFIFSGFKTYHSLSEVGLALIDADGKVKSFEVFRRDVEAIDKKYNTNYLYAEYNHALHTSQMAVKWHDFMADGDRYNLQYRTAAPSTPPSTTPRSLLPTSSGSSISRPTGGTAVAPSSKCCAMITPCPTLPLPRRRATLAPTTRSPRSSATTPDRR